MAFDSRQDLDIMEFRSPDGADFFETTTFSIGASPAFYAPLDTPFETLERATFAYRTHTLNCCPCGQDHSAELLAHKSAVAAGALQAQGASGPVNAPAGSPQAANFDFPGEIPGDVSTTFTLNIGDTVNSQIETSLDQDWFRITLQAGVTYEFRLEGTGANALKDPYLELMSSAGARLKFNDDGGTGLNSLLRFTPSTSGTYYINAHGWVDDNNTPYDTTDDFTSTGSYTLSASVAPPLPTYTIAQIAQYLVNGEDAGLGPRWQTNTITYNIEDLNADERAMAERALNMWSAVTPLTFTRTTGTANITFVNAVVDDPLHNPNDAGNPAAYARTSTSGNSIVRSTIVITTGWGEPQSGLSSGWFDSYAQQTYIHEIGHALGLGHSGPYNVSAEYGTDNLYTNDHWAYTVMSYFDQDDSAHGSYRYVLGLQQADIAAMHLLYGANPAGTFAGNTTFGFNSSAPGTNIDWSQYVLVSGVTYLRPPSMTIYDTGGVDTINLSGFAQPQILDLRPGTFSSLGDRPGQTRVHYENAVSIAEGTIIENAVGGSGNDTITGNTASNTITLGAGTDTFVYAPNGGADTITDFAVSADRIDLTAFSSADALAAFNGRTSLGGNTLLTFGAGQTILLQGVTTGQLAQSNLILSASPPPPPPSPGIDGTSGNDTLTGTANADTIRGLDGNDVLIGLAGNDQLEGGNGTDFLRGGDGADNHLGGEGFDLADYADATTGVSVNLTTGATSGAYAVGDTFTSIEGLVGSAFADTLTGSAEDNIIRGGNGNDILIGLAGNDQLEGGNGTDFIRGGTGADVHVGGEGFDLADYADATSGVSVNLSTGAVSGTFAAGDTFSSVEGLVGSAFADTLTGNAEDNVIRGGDGDDTLSGLAGSDEYQGGAGADTFVFNSGNDVVTDFGTASGDRVNVSAIAGITSLAALQAIHTQVGANSVFTFSAGNSITLNDVTLAQLNAGHFVFAFSAEPQDETGKAEISTPSGVVDALDTPFDFSGLGGSSASDDFGYRLLLLADFIRSVSVEDSASALSNFDIGAIDAFDFSISPDMDGWQT